MVDMYTIYHETLIKFKWDYQKKNYLNQLETEILNREIYFCGEIVSTGKLVTTYGNLSLKHAKQDNS